MVIRHSQEADGRTTMNTVLATLIAMSVLTGIVASANALDRRAYDLIFSTGQGD